jgi:hypothetical protein
MIRKKILHKQGKRTLSAILAFLLAVMLFPAAALSAFADDPAGGGDPGATTWTSPELYAPASLDVAVAGVTNWDGLYDPSSNIAEIKTQFAQINNLIEAYEPAKANPVVTWPEGDPGRVGGEIDDLAAAYNAYYLAVWEYVAAAKEKIKIDSINAEEQAAYDTAVTNFSDALVADIWNEGIAYSISPEPVWPELSLATINTKYNNLTVSPIMFSEVCAAAGAPMNLSWDNILQFTSSQAPTAVADRASKLSLWVNAVEGNQLQVVVYDNQVMTKAEVPEVKLFNKVIVPYQPPEYKDYVTTITTSLSQSTKDYAKEVAESVRTDNTQSEADYAAKKAALVDVEGNPATAVLGAQAAFSADLGDGITSAYEQALDLLNKTVKVFFQVVSGSQANGSTLSFAKGGTAKEIQLSVRATPEDDPDADFAAYEWKVSLNGEGKDAFEWSSEGDTLSITPKPDATGRAEVTVEIAYQNSGNYIVQYTPLKFFVESVDTVVFESDIIESTVDSASGETYVSLPGVLNSHGSLSYALAEGSTIGEAWERITLEGNRVKVAKDANSGTYEFAVVATDTWANGESYTAEATVRLTVTNAYDGRYLENRQKLQDIQDQVQPLIDALALLPEDDAVDPAYLAALNAFANITAPYDAMWNNGKPEINAEALGGLKEALNALKNIDPNYASIIDSAITIIDGVGNYLTQIPFDKTVMVDGYTLNLVFFEVPIPSLASTYVSAVTGVWDLFQGQVTPLTDLTDAYNALEDFVVNTDYASLDSLEDVNTYIQTLNKKYVDLDNALIEFNNSDSLVRDIVDLVLSNTANLLDLALSQWNDEANTTIAELVADLVDAQIPNEELRGFISESLVSVLDALRTVVQDSTAGLAEIDVSLEALLGYSAQVRAALSDAAAVSAFATGSYTYLKDLDLREYDFAQLDLLDDYLTQIYDRYLAGFDPAVGPTGDPAVAEELRKRINDARDRLLANDNVQTAIAVYNEIVDIYVFVNDAIAYFGSDQPEKDFEAAKQALCDELERLAEKAEAAGKEWLAQRIHALIEQIRDAAIEEWANISSQIHEYIHQVLAELEPYIDELKDAYADAVAAYYQAKAIYEKAVEIYQKAVEARELIEEIIEKAREFDYEDFLNRQLERLEQLLRDYIKQEIDQAKRDAIEALVDAIQELREEIANSQTLADIRECLAKAEELWHQAEEAFDTAVDDYHVIKPYVEQAIAFGEFVSGYDYEGIASLEEANAFLQELAAQYGEMHADFAGLADLSPGAQAVIDWTLQWTDDALLAALPYIEQIVDWQLDHQLEINTGNTQLDRYIRDIIREAADGGFDALQDIIKNSPDVTLAGLISTSAQVEQVIQALAEIGKLAVDAKAWATATIAEVLAQLSELKERIAAFADEARERIEQLVDDAVAFLEQAIAEGKEFIRDLYEDIAAGAEQLIAELHRIRDYVENYIDERKDELIAAIDELIDQIEQAGEDIAALVPVIEERLASLWADAVAAAAQAAEDVDAAIAAIDAAIRSIPNPSLLATEFSLSVNEPSVALATNYDGFFGTVANLLAEYLGLQYALPAYASSFGLPQGFTLTASGQLAVDPVVLVQTEEEYNNEVFARTLSIPISVTTGIKEVDELLAKLGISALVEQDVAVELALEPLEVPPAVSTLLGDADCDGKVLPRDANLVARYLVGLVDEDDYVTFSLQGRLNADTNKDRYPGIDGGDPVRILRISIGYSPER